MVRCAAFILLACLLGCSSPSKPFEEILPTQAGEWTRSSVDALDVASTPVIISQLGLKRAASATYSGPSSISLRVYEMNVPASAFELIQKWRQQEGNAVYTGPYFIVAASPPSPEAAALLEAVRKQIQ